MARIPAATPFRVDAHGELRFARYGNVLRLIDVRRDALVDTTVDVALAWRDARGRAPDARRAAGPRHRQSAAAAPLASSTTTTRASIAAVFASMIVAEQYFSFDSATARSTWRRSSPRPVTV